MIESKCLYRLKKLLEGTKRYLKIVIESNLGLNQVITLNMIEAIASLEKLDTQRQERNLYDYNFPGGGGQGW